MLTFQEAYFIGDFTTDIQAGRRAGTTTFLVLTGLGQESYRDYLRTAYEGRADKAECRPDKIFTDLYTATRWLVSA